MENSLRISVFVFIFVFCAFVFNSKGAQELLPFDNPEINISLDLQDAQLKDILKVLSIQSGLNFIASEALQNRTMTLYLDKVPIKEAMDKIFKANNLSYELDRDSNIFIVKDWGKPDIDMITKVFYLKYASVSSSLIETEKTNELASTTGGSSSSGSTGSTGSTSTSSSSSGSQGGGSTTENGITAVITKNLSEHGSIIEDKRTNSLIITEIPSRMPLIEKIIASLDVSVPQIMLEVEMLDVNKSLTDKLGFKYGTTPFSLSLLGNTIPVGFPFTSAWAKTFLTNDTIPKGSFSVNATSSYTLTIDFLKTQADTKILARPQILTLNNETAEIKITTDETVGILSTTSTGTTPLTTTTPERVETGVTLRVTPQVNTETGEITMFLVPTVKDTTTTVFPVQNGGGTTFQDPQERTTKSVVRVKNGDTIVLGGLIRNEKSETITKLPVLGDIPLVGGFFRHKEKSKDKERELLIFITPHLIKDSAIELSQAQKTNLPQREQGTTSGFDRYSTIASSLNNFETKRR